MELKDYWLTVRRRWRVVVATLVATLALAAAITLQATPQYDSSTRLFISTSESDSSSAYTGNLFATQRVASYADLVGSRQLADQVEDSTDGVVPAEDLRELVEATVVPETVILEITATHPDPEVAAQVAQAYAEQLQDLVRELETPQGETRALIKATIVDDAEVPDDAVSPQPARNLALADVVRARTR